MGKTALKYRKMISDAQRIVVKIGSRVLVQRSGRPDVRRMRCLVKELAALRRTGHDVIIVSSGAVGAGMEALGMKQRPTALPDIQMAAAVGQIRLISRYHDFFQAERCEVGQVLLTHADFEHKLRMTNARRTMENLLRNEVVPIVNENDVVADEELRAELKKFGDNDVLAALVTKLIRADLLIMLTTAKGVVQPGANGRSCRISLVEHISRSLIRSVEDVKGSTLSVGGMSSKLRAARDATRSGCYVVVANGRETGIIQKILGGKDVGTLIPAAPLA
jgi:glutamate 5-kinase